MLAARSGSPLLPPLPQAFEARAAAHTRQWIIKQRAKLEQAQTRRLAEIQAHRSVDVDANANQELIEIENAIIRENARHRAAQLVQLAEQRRVRALQRDAMFMRLTRELVDSECRQAEQRASERFDVAQEEQRALHDQWLNDAFVCPILDVALKRSAYEHLTHSNDCSSGILREWHAAAYTKPHDRTDALFKSSEWSAIESLLENDIRDLISDHLDLLESFTIIQSRSSSEQSAINEAALESWLSSSDVWASDSSFDDSQLASMLSQIVSTAIGELDAQTQSSLRSLPIHLSIRGPPFSGKRTQAALLADRLNVAVIDVEELARAQQIQPEQLSETKMIELVTLAIASVDSTHHRGWVLLDFPRTPTQAAALEFALTGFVPPKPIAHGPPVIATDRKQLVESRIAAVINAEPPVARPYKSCFDAVLNFCCPLTVCARRAVGRRVDASGRTFHIDREPPNEFELGKEQLKRTTERADEETNIADLYFDYNQSSNQLIEEWYSQFDCLVDVDASRIESEVLDGLAQIVNSRIPSQINSDTDSSARLVNIFPRFAQRGPALFDEVLDRELAMHLANTWIRFEDWYLREIQSVSQLISQSNLDEIHHYADINAELTALLEQEDARIEKLLHFQADFNVFSQDDRRDSGVKDELHLRCDELLRDLSMLVNTRKNVCQKFLDDCQVDGFVALRCHSLACLHLRLIECELRRHRTIVSIAQDLQPTLTGQSINPSILAFKPLTLPNRPVTLQAALANQAAIDEKSNKKKSTASAQSTIPSTPRSHTKASVTSQADSLKATSAQSEQAISAVSKLELTHPVLVGIVNQSAARLSDRISVIRTVGSNMCTASLELSSSWLADRERSRLNDRLTCEQEANARFFQLVHNVIEDELPLEHQIISDSRTGNLLLHC